MAREFARWLPFRAEACLGENYLQSVMNIVNSNCAPGTLRSDGPRSCLELALKGIQRAGMYVR